MEEQFDLYKSRNTIIITHKNVTLCKIDRFTLKNVNVQPSNEYKKIPFWFLLGLYKYQIQKEEYAYYLVLVTKTRKIDFLNVYQIDSFRIISLTKHQKTLGSQKFVELLRLGLIHCSMYFSDEYDLTLTLQHQFSNLPSRSFFIWNYEAINTLNKIWPYAIFFKKVIAGYLHQSYPFVIISRKSNRNGGCHTWNRGADINGNAANFVETEEIILLNNDFDLNDEKANINCHFNAISHIEIGGSCPFFWSQYPTMNTSRPYHFGPKDECERRFNLHFDHLFENYYITNDNDNKQKEKCSLVIISLLSNKGKELKLNTIYKELANKRGIEFKNINFNYYMNIKDGLSGEISKLKDDFDACVVKDGKVINKQTKIPRVNCSSCLDRTSVFMEILFKMIFQKYEPEVFNKSAQIHKNLWLVRADTISRQYAITNGQKTYLMETGYRTLSGRCNDYSISLQRFLYSIFYEGKYCDAYNAVLQERPFTKFDHAELFKRIILFIQLIFIILYLYVFKDKQTAAKTWRNRIKTIINHPHIPDLRDADEYDEIDFIDMREKSETPEKYPSNKLSSSNLNEMGLFMNEYSIYRI